MNRQTRLLLAFLVGVAGSLFALPAHAQLGYDLEIKKPEPYDNRSTKAEKTPDRPIKTPKRIMQNMVTHYNYYFNANNKLTEVLDAAKQQHRDNYTRLLPFYNFTLDGTAAQTQALDSIIIKSKTGIVLHDLRNDWIDNMYFLWGSAYYFQKQFDSAYTMFQFINWSFASKEKDGYYRYIGSRMDGNSALQVATKEKKQSFPRRMFTEPPSRNDALLWQVRTLIEQNAYVESGSLLNTLRNDPTFPARLRDDLEEVQAYWFYRQDQWDSSARHLVLGLGTAGTRQEKARWEYLAAQMFERSGHTEEAKTWYAKAIDHSDDPVMEVYARLNLIRINKEGGDNYIDRNIATLLKMVRRDKYEEYRDVIYSMLAQMELERGNLRMAQEYLQRSSKYRSDNVTVSNDAYLALADRAFDQKLYPTAARYYDSVKLTGMQADDSLRVLARKPQLTKLIYFTGTVERQDSLQRIAALSNDERKDFIRKLARQLRRAKGLKEEADYQSTRDAGTADPFATTAGNRGEWYFYNDNSKRSGAAAFKQIWGDRPNVDNWRRQTDVATQLRNKVTEATRNVAKGGGPVVNDDPLSYEALLANVPLSPEALKTSHDSIQYALRGLAQLYAADMEDYSLAIETLENLRRRYPQPDSLEQVLFGLYFAYRHAGNAAKADEMKRLLQSTFPNGRYTAIASTGKDPASTTAVQKAATKTYEDIYDLYLAGRFAEAEAAKVQADSVYRTNTWNPQLLYIQAVAQVKQQQDSNAVHTLQTLITQNPNTALAAKAQTLIDVLKRRSQIEEELRNLQVEQRPVDTTTVVAAPKPAAPVVAPVTVPATRDSVVTQRPTPPKAQPQRPRTDTVAAKPVTVPPVTAGPYRFNPDSSHYAVVVLNKVDIVFGNEARNAFSRYNASNGQPADARIEPLGNDVKLLLIGPFVNAKGAIDYVLSVKPIAGSQIVPWLKASSYTFTILSPGNLGAVQTAKSLDAYQQFLESKLPVKL
ncbi:MAG: tetratricopeptide repeat protein [Chitinophagaceae bacterium]|nr:MAG: tetratricopeptide repeat protein [Chitinophagaceae bacterium]